MKITIELSNEEMEIIDKSSQILNRARLFCDFTQNNINLTHIDKDRAQICEQELEVLEHVLNKITSFNQRKTKHVINTVNHTIIVGWNSSLQSYYVEIYNNIKTKNLELFQEVVQNYVTLSTDLINQLELEKRIFN